MSCNAATGPKRQQLSVSGMPSQQIHIDHSLERVLLSLHIMPARGNRLGARRTGRDNDRMSWLRQQRIRSDGTAEMNINAMLASLLFRPFHDAQIGFAMQRVRGRQDLAAQPVGAIVHRNLMPALEHLARVPCDRRCAAR